MAGPLLIALVHGIVAVALAGRLELDAWVVSDPGARLIAAENVLRHPNRPFETDLPQVSPDIVIDWPQPYFPTHGDHAHPVMPQVFPILIAPFLWAFGLPGLLVLPILAWVAIGPLTARLAGSVGIDTSPSVVALVSVIGTPLLFYGLELWEHTPAVACLVGAGAWLLNREARLRSLIAGGALAMLAFQLRPETAPSVLAIALVLMLRRSRTALLALVFGAGLMALPIVVYNVAHFGQITSPHVAGNMAVLSAHWWSLRLQYASTWFAWERMSSTVAFATLAIAWLLTRMTRFRSAGQAVGVLAAMYLAFEMAKGHEHREHFIRVFPVALLALVPTVPLARVSRDLLLLIVVPAVGCWLTAPNDGALWGPRYLLPIVPMVLLVAVGNMTHLMRQSRLTAMAALWIILGGLFVSKGAIGEVTATKRNYSRGVHETASAATGTSYVMTSTWWVPAAHAGVIDARTMVYVETTEQAARVLRAIAPAAVLIVSEIDSPVVSFVEASTGTCYAVQPMRPHVTGRLQSARLSCK